MKENSGELSPDEPVYGKMTLDGREIDMYMELDLPPRGSKKLEACSEHLRDGRVGEMLNDFMLAGCHAPEEDEDQIVRTALVCSGPSMFKNCRLRLLQAKRSGEVITEGKYEEYKN